jgi:hypothetical protein
MEDDFLAREDAPALLRRDRRHCLAELVLHRVRHLGVDAVRVQRRDVEGDDGRASSRLPSPPVMQSFTLWAVSLASTKATIAPDASTISTNRLEETVRKRDVAHRPKMPRVRKEA